MTKRQKHTFLWSYIKQQTRPWKLSHILLKCFIFTSIVSLSLHLLLHFFPPSLPLSRPSLRPSQDKLCLPHHILEEKGLVKVCVTVQALVDEASSKPPMLV